MTQVKPPLKMRKLNQIATKVSSKTKESTKIGPKAAGGKVGRPQEIDSPNRINWSDVDLSKVSLPAPRKPEPQLQYENGRDFFKHPHRYMDAHLVLIFSRKVYLHTLYTNLLLRHPVLLFFNVNAVDNYTLTHLRNALAPHGAEFRVIRRKVFLAALRVAKYIEASRPRSHELWDPSGLAMHAKILPRRRATEELEMKSLLKGYQPCAIYFNDFNWRPESIDLGKIAAVMRLVEKSGKTPILGARFQRSVATVEDMKRVRSMESVNRVREELIGILGGAAQALAGTLSAPAGGLAFTLERRKKAIEDQGALEK